MSLGEALCGRSGPHPPHRWAVGRGGRDLYWCEGVEEPAVVHTSDEQKWAFDALRFAVDLNTSHQLVLDEARVLRRGAVLEDAEAFYQWMKSKQEEQR